MDRQTFDTETGPAARVAHRDMNVSPATAPPQRRGWSLNQPRRWNLALPRRWRVWRPRTWTLMRIERTAEMVPVYAEPRRR